MSSFKALSQSAALWSIPTPNVRRHLPPVHKARLTLLDSKTRTPVHATAIRDPNDCRGARGTAPGPFTICSGVRETPERNKRSQCAHEPDGVSHTRKPHAVASLIDQVTATRSNSVPPCNMMVATFLITYRYSTNDILSALGQCNSLVPLLYLENGSMQASMDLAVRLLQDQVERFERVRDGFRSRVKQTLDPNRDVNFEKFITGCEYACTANLAWSLRSPRYGLCTTTTQHGLIMDL
nr:hypothetical protein CFP56_65479 [Quercus suber]